MRRRGGTRALDIGCGTGLLLKRLAAVLPQVVGVESDHRAAISARATIADLDDTTVIEAPFELGMFAPASFDLVTLVASLHHLPLDETLEEVRGLLRPGGRLIIIGLARESPADLPWSLTSLILNPLIGMIRHPRRTTDTPESMNAPVADPAQSFAQIRAAALKALPGVRMRRGLFWRYTAVWTRGAGRDDPLERRSP